MFTYFNSVGTTWNELNLTSIGVGTGITQYTGSEYRIKSIMFYGILASGAVNGAADDDFNCFRIILASWMDSAGTTPCTTYAMDYQSKSPSRENGFKFLRKKYMDRTIYLVNTADADGTGYIPKLKKVSYYKRFKGAGLRIKHDHSGAYQESHIVLSMVSDSSAVPNPGFITGWWRVRYYDN